MSTKKLIKALGLIIVVALLAAALPLQVKAEGETVIPVYVLSPSWDAEGGGGVFSSYLGPEEDDVAISPGYTGLYQGKEAGIIKAGIKEGTYWDEGLFGFIPNITIETLAAGPLTYDVIAEAGVNPVWMTIELDTGTVGNRNDNTTYQFVPTTNPVEWHTVNAAGGQWQKWNNNQGDTTGNEPISLADVALAHPGVNVVRVYLRLGMGDSYYNNGTGTINWVDKVQICNTIYDFQVKNWYVAPTGSDTNLGTPDSPFATIQHAIDVASDGDTINVAAGTYDEDLNINKGVTLRAADLIETVVLSDTAGPGVWFPDRYRPAVFEAALWEGRNAIKHGVRAVDSLENRPVPYKSTFYNTQGRKYLTSLSGGVQRMSIDLWVDENWKTKQAYAGLWSTGYDNANAPDFYPILAWRSVAEETAGFYYWDDNGWHLAKEAEDNDYDAWHTLAFELTVGTGIQYYLDGQPVGTVAEVETVSLNDVILNVYNYGEDYDVYWDNFSTHGVNIVGQATVNASGVTFDGFNLSNPGANFGMLVNPGFSNVTITGNTFENIGAVDFADNVKAFICSPVRMM
jgi:hypothetical protein